MYWRVGKLHLSRKRVGGHRETRSLRPPAGPCTKHNPFLGFFPTFELAVHPLLFAFLRPLLSLSRPPPSPPRPTSSNSLDLNPLSLSLSLPSSSLSPPSLLSPLPSPRELLSTPARSASVFRFHSPLTLRWPSRGALSPLLLMRYRGPTGEIRTSSSGPQARVEEFAGVEEERARG